MKKLSVKKYTKLLYELVDLKTEHEMKLIVGGFVELLAKHKNLRLANRIIEEFKKLYHQKHGIAFAKVTSVRELDHVNVKEIKKWVSDYTKQDKVEIENVLDKDLKGGIMIEVGEERLDLSIAKRMEDLKEAIRR